MTELSHSWYDADKEQELELLVLVNDAGEVQDVKDLWIWSNEDGISMAVLRIDISLAKSSGILDTMLAQVDWKKKLAEHIAANSE